MQLFLLFHALLLYDINSYCQLSFLRKVSVKNKTELFIAKLNKKIPLILVFCGLSSQKPIDICGNKFRGV